MQTIFIQIMRSQALRGRRCARRREQVLIVHSTSGQYDLLVKCYPLSDLDIGHFVNERSSAARIKDTLTLIAFKAFCNGSLLRNGSFVSMACVPLAGLISLYPASFRITACACSSGDCMMSGA